MALLALVLKELTSPIPLASAATSQTVSIVIRLDVSHVIMDFMYQMDNAQPALGDAQYAHHQVHAVNARTITSY